MKQQQQAHDVGDVLVRIAVLAMGLFGAALYVWGAYRYIAYADSIPTLMWVGTLGIVMCYLCFFQLRGLKWVAAALLVPAVAVSVASLLRKDTLTGREFTPVAITDLGLSVDWAGWNYDEQATYFDWTEADGHSRLMAVTYEWDTHSKPPTLRGQWELRPDDMQRWHGADGWRLPTVREVQELIDNCDYAWVKYGDQWGGLFTSRVNGHSIFLPATECAVQLGGRVTSYSVDHAKWGLYVVDDGEQRVLKCLHGKQVEISEATAEKKAIRLVRNVNVKKGIKKESQDCSWDFALQDGLEPTTP